MVDWQKRAIASVRAGTPDLDAIYRAYATVMKQTATRKLKSSDNATLGLSADDIISAVIEGVCDGSVKLEPSVAGHLRSYLRRVTANHAVSLIRSRVADTRAQQKRHPVDLTNVQDDVETVVLAEQVEEQLGILTERERYVIIEHVKNERSRNDVAAELNCTPQNISQLRKSALRKLFAQLLFADIDSDDQQMKNDREEGTA
jgi:RNA polymerase sigma factor (sigma-70 family)